MKYSSKNKPLSLLWLGCGDICARSAACLPRDAVQLTAVSRSKKHLQNEHQHHSANATDRTWLVNRIHASVPALVVISMTPGGRSAQHYRDSYLLCVNNLLSALEETGASPTIIFVSSTSVYHQHHGEWVDEGSATVPDKPTAQVLLEAEQRLHASCFKTCSVRFSGIYGPGRFHLLAQVHKGILGEDHVTNRIHVDDCVGVLCFLIERVRIGLPLPTILLASDNEPVGSHVLRAWLAARLDATAQLPLAEGHAPRASGRANRRCDNALLKKLGYVMKFGTYQQGFPRIIAEFNATLDR